MSHFGFTKQIQQAKMEDLVGLQFSCHKISFWLYLISLSLSLRTLLHSKGKQMISGEYLVGSLQLRCFRKTPRR